MTFEVAHVIHQRRDGGAVDGAIGLVGLDRLQRRRVVQLQSRCRAVSSPGLPPFIFYYTHPADCLPSQMSWFSGIAKTTKKNYVGRVKRDIDSRLRSGPSNP